MADKFNADLIIMHVINEPVDLRGFYVPHISFETMENEIVLSAGKMMDEFCNKKLENFTDYEKYTVLGVPYEEILKKAGEEKVDARRG